MEDTIRYRLKMTELVPVEMGKYRIGVFYLFTSSLFDLTNERTNQTTLTSGRQSILHSPPPLRNLPLSPRRQKRRRRVVFRARRVPNWRWRRFNWDARYVNLCSPSIYPSPGRARAHHSRNNKFQILIECFTHRIPALTNRHNPPAQRVWG